MDKMNKKIEETLERQFPKGHLARGEALVLHAVAQIELEKAVQQAKKECAKEKCLFKRQGWISYAVYHNNIHILETRSLSRAINLFKSL